MAAAYRTGNVVFPDICDHLLRAHALYGYVLFAVLLVPVLYDIVSSLSCLALLAVDKGIRETAYVTGCHPCLGVHDDSGIETYVIRALLHELLPPCGLDVVLELNA